MPICVICGERLDDNNYLSVELANQSQIVVCVWCALLVVEHLEQFKAHKAN
jgi:hypothetical protein